MRVLSLAAAAAAAIAIVLAGCYEPAIADCQFTCPDNVCPGDLACMSGICRPRGATGSCPCPDPPMGCGLTSNNVGLCLAACSAPRAWPAARTACAATPPWHLAVLDTSNTLSAAENALQSSTVWIGLTRGAPLGDWMWIVGGDTIGPLSSEWTSDTNHGGATSTCAAISNGKLYSDGCDTLHPFACTAN